MNTKLYYEYCSRVLNGEIIAGETIKLACKRFQNDLQRDDLEFKEDKVDRAILFISTLKHYTGRHSGKPFTLEGWQQFIIANIVGFYWKGTTTRRYTSSYIEVSRKQGKTALAAALCLYYLIADGEDGAEVLLAANSKEQAKIAFDMCSKFSKGLDSKGKYLTAYRADILFNLTNSKLKVLAADDSKLDGFNASFGLLDEYHAAKNSKVRDVIKSSMGMRMNPHLCTITTAGFDKTLPCYQLRTVAIEVLNGLKVDDEMFIAIYSLDADDDWRNEKNWIKCAPNLDITVTSKYIRGQVQQAINNPAFFSEMDEQKRRYAMVTDSILLPLGLQNEHRGTEFLRLLVCMRIFGVDADLKRMYEYVAMYYHSTPAAVERAIRYSIECAWEGGNLYMQFELFGNTTDSAKGKPTNAEFIATVVQHIRNRLRHGSAAPKAFPVYEHDEQ